LILFNVDFSHFTNQGWNIFGHEKFGNSGESIDEYFSENSCHSTSNTRQRLLNNKLKEYKCEKCGLTKWNNSEITLQLHHINGNCYDNRLENLQLLCPNCHSQTENYCGKKMKH
jgi:5-methylcytosine-specific restriction endonuclease McrA